MDAPVERMSISEARRRLLSLPRALSRREGPRSVAVTKRGKPVMALVEWELYESLLETLEVLGEPELMGVLRESLRELEAGRTVPWEQAKKRLGL